MLSHHAVFFLNVSRERSERSPVGSGKHVVILIVFYMFASRYVGKISVAAVEIIFFSTRSAVETRTVNYLLRIYLLPFHLSDKMSVSRSENARRERKIFVPDVIFVIAPVLIRLHNEIVSAESFGDFEPFVIAEVFVFRLQLSVIVAASDCKDKRKTHNCQNR